MKVILLVPTLILAILAITLPVWASVVGQPEASGSPATETTQAKIDSLTKDLEELRLEMEAASKPEAQRGMMNKHMQNMKKGYENEG